MGCDMFCRNKEGENYLQDFSGKVSKLVLVYAQFFQYKIVLGAQNNSTYAKLLVMLNLYYRSWTTLII